MTKTTYYGRRHQAQVHRSLQLDHEGQKANHS